MIQLPSEDTATEVFAGPDRETLDVPVHRIKVDRWSEKIEFEVGSYTNKVLIDHEGEPVFPEIALVRIARAQGWDAAWIDTYHQDRRWQGMPEQSEPCDLPPEQEERLTVIKGRHGRSGGCWDVIAWREEAVAFIESKSTDRIHDNQRTWFAAAVSAGIPPSAFAIAEWKIAGSVARGARSRSQRGDATSGSSSGMPIELALEAALPASYQDKVKRLGLSLVSDNTLRRVKAGAGTYPSRVDPLVKRNLIADDGTRLTEAGLTCLTMLDAKLPAGGYPAKLLE